MHEMIVNSSISTCERITFCLFRTNKLYALRSTFRVAAPKELINIAFFVMITNHNQLHNILTDIDSGVILSLR